MILPPKKCKAGVIERYGRKRETEDVKESTYLI